MDKHDPAQYFRQNKVRAEDQVGVGLDVYVDADAGEDAGEDATRNMDADDTDAGVDVGVEVGGCEYRCGLWMRR